jgi:hypothetical protein
MDFKKDISFKREGFKIPNGYFESINYKTFQRNEINTGKFIVPVGYFKSLDKQQIFNKIYINKIRIIKSTFYRVTSLAAIFIGLVYFSNYFDNNSYNINSEDVINYVNQDFIIIDNSEYGEMLDFNDLNYNNLISQADVENYFIETSYSLENLIFE